MKGKVIAIVGMCGTGKSVVSKHINETQRFELIYFGGYVLAEVKKRKLEINSTNEKTVREELREEFGNDVMAKKAIDDIVTYLEKGMNVVIDGLYSFSEYQFLKERLKDRFFLLAVHSGRKIRYERLGKREVRPLSPEQIDQRDFFEITNIEKAGPIAIADFHIINNGKFEELYVNIDNILAQLTEKN